MVAEGLPAVTPRRRMCAVVAIVLGPVIPLTYLGASALHYRAALTSDMWVGSGVVLAIGGLLAWGVWRGSGPMRFAAVATATAWSVAAALMVFFGLLYDRADLVRALREADLDELVLDAFAIGVVELGLALTVIVTLLGGRRPALSASA